MRFGICTGLNNINILGNIGCDYIEIALNNVVSLNDEEFLEYVQLIKNSKVKCEAANCFFPGSMKIVGKDIDKNKISEYIKNALHRASLLGVKVFVVGSGNSRKCPGDWAKEAAVEQFSKVLFEIAEEAKKYDMIATVEPLNKKETDFYHMRVEQENINILRDTSQYLHHVHIANSNGRVYPLNKDEDDYEAFFNILRQIGYNNRVSIEASSSDMKKEGAASLNLLRQYVL